MRDSFFCLNSQSCIFFNWSFSRVSLRNQLPAFTACTSCRRLENCWCPPWTWTTRSSRTSTITCTPVVKPSSTAWRGPPTSCSGVSRWGPDEYFNNHSFHTKAHIIFFLCRNLLKRLWGRPQMISRNFLVGADYFE